MDSTRIEENALEVTDTDVEAAGGPGNSNKRGIAKTPDELLILRKKDFSELLDVEV